MEDCGRSGRMGEAARARRKARARRLLALALALAAALALALAAPPGVARAEGAGVPVYRLYNRWSGEHLFTTDESEYESLQGLGWSGEGEAWTSPSEGDAVFRLYNPYSGDHHYTMDQGEYDGLGRIGWRREGRAFFSADASRGVPVYRLFNRWLTQGTHLFTGDEGEYDRLGRIGWQREGVAFYAMGGGPFTVRFISWDDSEGREVTVSEKTLAAGERISVPESPARDGYEFRGWGDGVEDGMACTRDATYEAQWAPVSPADYTTDDGAEVSGVSFSEDVRASENGVVNSVSDDGTLSVTVPAGEVGDLGAGNVLVLGKDDVASGIAVKVSSIKTNPDGSATVSGSVPDDLSEVVDSIDVSYDGPLQVDDPVYGSGVTEGADIDRSSLHAAELDGDAGGEAIPPAAPRPLRKLGPAADVPFDFNATVDIGEADGSLTKSQIRSMRSKLKKKKKFRNLSDDDIDKMDEDTLSWLSGRHAVKPKASGKLKVAASGTLHIRFSFRNGDVDSTVFVDDASALFGFDGSVKVQLPIHLIAGYVGPVLLDLDVKFEGQGSANAMFGIEGFAFGVDETGTHQASRGHVRYGVPEGKVGFSVGLSGGAMLGVYGVASVDGELYGGVSADGAITPRRDAKACADLSIRPLVEATATVSLVPMKSEFSVDPFKNVKASLHLEGEKTDLGSWRRVSACTWKVVYEGDDGKVIKSVDRSWGEPLLRDAPAEPAKRGYTFVGWKRKGDADTALVKASDVYTGGVTLVPVWKSDPEAAVASGSLGEGCSWKLDGRGTLTVYPTDGVSGTMSKIEDGVGANLGSVSAVVIAKGVRAPEDSTYLFSGLFNMSSVDASNLDVSGVTDMSYMFQSCGSVSDLSPLASWDVSGVTDMSYMFDGCGSVSDLSPLASWDDVSGVTHMDDMFRGCGSVSDLSPLASWDVSGVTDMSGMFTSCGSVSDLSPLASWDDVSGVTDMSCMFSGCGSVSDLSPLASWDVSGVTDMSGMFASCGSVSDLSPLASWDVSGVKYMSGMFKSCGSVSDLSPLASWDVSGVEGMGTMFMDCRSVSDLSPLASWDVSGATGMSWMFYDCRSVSDLSPLASWDVSGATDMSCMFGNCGSVSDLSPLASWDVSGVINMDSMFWCCYSVSDLSPLASWDVSGVTNMDSMFYGCRSVSDLSPLASWDVSGVTNMSSMFGHCDRLTDATALNAWKVGANVYKAYMFPSGCARPSWC